MGGLSIAGTNNRYNSFTIDGTVANDVFGLTANGMNGGQAGANPISMDAIQELQVVVAPFDVRQGGFTGGGINAVTKQGTNTTHGSAYAYYNNEKFYGRYNAAKDWAKDPLNEQYDRTFGGTLGGAIIKDKLFYFVSAEGKKSAYPSPYAPGYSDTYLSAQTAQEILDRYTQLTGKSDNYGQRDVESKQLGLLARIDWNINDRHKLALRYQYQNAWQDKWASGYNTYYFANSGYRFYDKTHSVVAELNSHLSDKLYNELRASATIVRDHREAPNDGPSVLINNVKGADGKTNNRVYLGTEQYSGANELDQDTYTLEDNLSWYLGNHTLTFGTHNEIYSIRNLFMANANGYFAYGSLDDYYDDRAQSFGVTYSDAALTGSTRYAPTLKAGQFGFYGQDKWAISQNLTFTYGIRFDIPTFFNSPTTNPAFNDFAAANGIEARVGDVPSTKLLVSPRIGFNWYTDDSHRTLLRGGLGIFTGRVPFVWISNAYNNNGMEVRHFSYNNYSQKDAPGMTATGHGDGSITPGEVIEASQSLSAKAEEINTVSRSFRFPQVLRANLALEQRLPGDVKMTLEGIYSKGLHNVFFENLALENTGAKVYAVPGVEASAAPYYSLRQSNYSNIIHIKNTKEGYSYALSALFEKSFDFGLDVAASYTFGHSKSVNDGTSSQAYSNWKYNYSRDTNGKGELGYSKFDVPHRIMVQLNYTSPKYLRGLMSTSVSIIYNAIAGGRYSLTMNESEDYNGDGYTGNSLLYIPTHDELGRMNFVDITDKSGNVTTSAEESRRQFEQWIENDSYAKNHRGQYAERNSNLTPWEHEINLHIGQTIYNPKGFGKYRNGFGKLEITLDIINLANLLNKNWGATYGNAYNVSPLSVSRVATSQDGMTATPSFTYNPNSNPQPSSVSSRWHMQVGLRLSF